MKFIQSLYPFILPLYQ